MAKTPQTLDKTARRNHHAHNIGKCYVSDKSKCLNIVRPESHTGIEFEGGGPAWEALAAAKNNDLALGDMVFFKF